MNIDGHLRRDVEISDDTNLTGMISGNVLVIKNVTFYCAGMVIGNICIQPGAKLVLDGTVNGDIINHGRCEIKGVVNGRLVGEPEKFYIDLTARITP